MEAAWQAGEQTAGWADEFDSDAARDAPLNDPTAISWVREYNTSLQEPHRAQPLGPAAEHLITSLQLRSRMGQLRGGPGAPEQALSRQAAAVETAVLRTPTAEAVRELAQFRSRTGDCEGAALAVERLIELGAADAGTVRAFLLQCAPDLPPKEVLRFVGCALLGHPPPARGAPGPAADELVAELRDLARPGGPGAGDPGAHLALGLVLDRVCDSQAEALAHYRASMALMLADASSDAASAPLPAVAALAALAAGADDAALSEALRAAPSAPAAWAALARRRSAAGDWVTAARCALRAAVASGPDASRFWDGLAIALCALGRDDLAHVALLGRERLAAEGSHDTLALQEELLAELRRMGS
ncbi:hypothetical protein QBZ16_001151 [Prototheca wickerhamii]|uniref:Uncharacterized protein n=1 Tax=Prototheca wickerhamii TaxID=3111 RepID=A0AAD9IDP8_PROWI|nr:hypothetical protein QBZ16_001151 [Prototheca wickerhamii]